MRLTWFKLWVNDPEIILTYDPSALRPKRDNLLRGSDSNRRSQGYEPCEVTNSFHHTIQIYKLFQINFKNSLINSSPSKSTIVCLVSRSLY